MKNASILTACLLCFFTSVERTFADEVQAKRLSFGDFLDTVLKNNPDRAAQLTREKSFAAATVAAKQIPDPRLAIGADSIDLGHRDAPLIFSVGIEEEIELGGKHGARVESAQADEKHTMAETISFTMDLLREASEAWASALVAHQQLARKEQTLASLERLDAVNRERVRAGDIGEVEVVQSSIEVERFRGEIVKAQAIVKNADLRLSTLAGTSLQGDGNLILEGSLAMASQTSTLDVLLSAARKNNMALKVLRSGVLNAEKRLHLAKAAKWPNLTVGAGWIHTTAGKRNFESEPSNALMLSTSIPIPFSMLNQGAIQQAHAERLYAQKLLEAAEHALDSSVRGAIERYDAARKRLMLFNGSIVQNAEKVRDARLYSYQRGQSSLLEELHAEQTLNEVYLEQIEALENHVKALIEIQHLTGIPTRLPL